MDSEKWRKISELFDAALDLPAAERAAFLDRACEGDEEIRLRVEEMLATDARSDLLMDRPAYHAVGTLPPTLFTEDGAQSFTGEMIGTYRLIRQLGRGGMGTVYLAYDARLGRQVALKFLPSTFHSPERVRRLEREARSASALNHPNIITIYDFGHENGRDFIASEFVEGHTLREHIGANDLTLRKILDVTIQVASALGTAHMAGIIHRDIKPENIMLRPDGYVKVLDFGLAKLTENEFESDDESDSEAISVFETRTGAVLGTTNYMSPEQVRGQKLDGRSDLFSLGVVLYELITDHRPFQGETLFHTMVAITDSEPLPLMHHVQGVPDALQKIIIRLLAKNPDERYPTAQALISDLEGLQSDVATDARVEPLDGETQKPGNASQHTTLIADHSAVITDRSAKDTKESTTDLPVSVKWLRFTLIAAIVVLVAAAIYFYFIRGIG